MVDESDVKRAHAHWAGRAAMAQRMGDEDARTYAWAEAERLGLILDRMDAEAEWNTLAGSPDHG